MVKGKFKAIKVYCEALWNYRHVLTLELFYFFYLVPSTLFINPISNFPLEKACRTNLRYSKLVCDATLDKTAYGVECEGFSFENKTTGSSESDWNITVDSFAFNYTVCKAEVESKNIELDVTGQKSIAVAISFITVLFGGSWADRYNQQKLLMAFPIIGELLSFTGLLLSAIFFESLPMEFGAYIETYVPALFGGFPTVNLSVFSYMTLTTSEQNRFFRFGIFFMVYLTTIAVGTSLSGSIFKNSGYIVAFSVAIFSEIFAILCVVFVIQDAESETKKIACPIQPTDSQSPAQFPTHAPPSLTVASVNNSAQEAAATSLNDASLVVANQNLEVAPKSETPKETTKSVKRNICLEIFDPEVIKDFVLFPLIKRKDNQRLILILLLSAFFLTSGSTTIDGNNWYRHALVNLGWTGTDFSFGFAIVSGSSLLGTFIGVVLFNKVLGINTALIAVISLLSTILSRIVYAFATDTITFYIGGVVELFTFLCVIAIKCIGSCIVAQDELSKLFASFELCHPISDVIFPLMFDEVYTRTMKDFPGAVFLFVEIFYILSAIAFIVCYFLLRSNATKNEKIIKAEIQPELAPNAQECGLYRKISSF